MRTLAEHDLQGRWGMTTLTLPGDWTRYVDDAADFKAKQEALFMRWDRRYGAVGDDGQWDGERVAQVWKVETQERSAPHSHALSQLPEGEHARGNWKSVKTFLSVNWHQIVVHAGRQCPLDDGYDGTDTCPEPHHRWAGARLDVSYSDIPPGKSIAAYFSKHGVWSSKSHQNLPAGVKIRHGLFLMSFMSGIPLPDSALVPEVEDDRQGQQRLDLDDGDAPVLLVHRPVSSHARAENETPIGVGLTIVPKLDAREYEQRFLGAVWGDWLDLADSWSNCGRWWGIRGTVERPEADVAVYPADQLEAMRLICRKLFTRRTTRRAEVRGADGRELHTTGRDPRPNGRPAGIRLSLVCRRSLRSLRSVYGWTMLSADPDTLRPWLEAKSAELALVPPGRARAQWLVGLREPTDSTGQQLLAI
jgi:hypothetical protein